MITLLCPNLHRITRPFATTTQGIHCPLCDPTLDYEIQLDLNIPTVAQEESLISPFSMIPNTIWPPQHNPVTQKKGKFPRPISPPKIADLTALSFPACGTELCDWTCPLGHIYKSYARYLEVKSRHLQKGELLCPTCIINALQTARNVTCLETNKETIDLRHSLRWKCNLCSVVFYLSVHGTHKC